MLSVFNYIPFIQAPTPPVLNGPATDDAAAEQSGSVAQPVEADRGLTTAFLAGREGNQKV
jgi:hypothetical protein